jgi:hypothetical protein
LMTGWWVISSSPTVSTVQPSQNFRRDVKQGVSAGISATEFSDFGHPIPGHRSLRAVARLRGTFGAPSPHSKIPFPAAGLARDFQRHSQLQLRFRAN